MGGAYLKITLKGKQDEFLTGNASRNFFIKAYENTFDFSVDQIKLYFIEDVDFGKKISLTFPKQADLLHKTYFCFNLPALTFSTGTFVGWTNNIGHAIIDYIDLEIGDKLISRYHGLYLDIWEELTGVTHLENIMLGKYSNNDVIKNTATEESEYVVPLPFWFCKRYSSAFPMICLIYHQVKITIKLKEFSKCVLYDGVSEPSPVKISNPYILADYIFLEDSLKIRIKSKPQRLLIEQVQSKDTSGEDSNSSNGIFKTSLPFNHPVKELLWVFIEDENFENNDLFNYSKRNLIPFTKVFSLMKNAKLNIDGKDYSELKDEIVYRVTSNHKNITDKHIYTLPFCLFPEDIEPSGTLNFSKIDSVNLYGEMRTPTPLNKMYVFAVNYNWLNIQNGLSSLMFIT